MLNRKAVKSYLKEVFFPYTKDTFILGEELTRDQKEMVDGWNRNVEFSDNIFKDSDRIEIPYEADDAEPNSSVLDYLKSQGYEVDKESYKKGHAVQKLPNGRDRVIRIGKIVAKDPQIKSAFENDPARIGKGKSEYKIIISRDKYDVAGMSTDRGWRSCMNLVDGQYKEYVKEDIRYGTHIAYLVKNDDNDIKKPLGRVLLKPLNRLHGEHTVIRPEDRVYGTVPSDEKFRKAVMHWAGENFKMEDDVYAVNGELYDDGLAEREYISLAALKKYAKTGQPIEIDEGYPKSSGMPDPDPAELQIASKEEIDPLFKSIYVRHSFGNDIARNISVVPEYCKKPGSSDMLAKIDPDNLKDISGYIQAVEANIDRINGIRKAFVPRVLEKPEGRNLFRKVFDSKDMHSRAVLMNEIEGTLSWDDVLSPQEITDIVKHQFDKDQRHYYGNIPTIKNPDIVKKLYGNLLTSIKPEYMANILTKNLSPDDVYDIAKIGNADLKNVVTVNYFSRESNRLKRLTEDQVKKIAELSPNIVTSMKGRETGSYNLELYKFMEFRDGGFKRKTYEIDARNADYVKEFVMKSAMSPDDLDGFLRNALAKADIDYAYVEEPFLNYDMHKKFSKINPNYPINNIAYHMNMPEFLEKEPSIFDVNIGLTERLFLKIRNSHGSIYQPHIDKIESLLSNLPANDKEYQITSGIFDRLTMSDKFFKNNIGTLIKYINYNLGSSFGFNFRNNSSITYDYLKDHHEEHSNDEIIEVLDEIQDHMPYDLANTLSNRNDLSLYQIEKILQKAPYEYLTDNIENAALVVKTLANRMAHGDSLEDSKLRQGVLKLDFFKDAPHAFTSVLNMYVYDVSNWLDDMMKLKRFDMVKMTELSNLPGRTKNKVWDFLYKNDELNKDFIVNNFRYLTLKDLPFHNDKKFMLLMQDALKDVDHMKIFNKIEKYDRENREKYISNMRMLGIQVFKNPKDVYEAFIAGIDPGNPSDEVFKYAIENGDIRKFVNALQNLGTDNVYAKFMAYALKNMSDFAIMENESMLIGVYNTDPMRFLDIIDKKPDMLINDQTIAALLYYGQAQKDLNFWKRLFSMIDEFPKPEKVENSYFIGNLQLVNLAKQLSSIAKPEEYLDIMLNSRNMRMLVMAYNLARRGDDIMLKMTPEHLSILATHEPRWIRANINKVINTFKNINTLIRNAMTHDDLMDNFIGPFLNNCSFHNEDIARGFGKEIAEYLLLFPSTKFSGNAAYAIYDIITDAFAKRDWETGMKWFSDIAKSKINSGFFTKLVGIESMKDWLFELVGDINATERLKLKALLSQNGVDMDIDLPIPDDADMSVAPEAAPDSKIKWSEKDKKAAAALLSAYHKTQEKQLDKDGIMKQAARLGLTYFKWGRFGKVVDGKNRVTHVAKDGKLVEVGQT